MIEEQVILVDENDVQIRTKEEAYNYLFITHTNYYFNSESRLFWHLFVL